MDSLSRTDASQVTIALIGEHQVVGVEALGCAGYGWRTAVSGLNPVDIYVVVCKNGAAHRTDADGAFRQSHLLDYLGNELVHNAVTAAWAVMHGRVVQKRGLLIDEGCCLYKFFACHFTDSFLCYFIP